MCAKKMSCQHARRATRNANWVTNPSQWRQITANYYGITIDESKQLLARQVYPHGLYAPNPEREAGVGDRHCHGLPCVLEL